MRPTKFKHQNCTYAENQPDYMPLPALKIQSEYGEVVSCWRMSFRDRVKVLFTGKVWLSLMSFNKPLTPSFMSVNRKDVYEHPDDTDKIVNKNVKLFYGLLNKNLGLINKIER